jgi:hypothetical protein
MLQIYQQGTRLGVLHFTLLMAGTIDREARRRIQSLEKQGVQRDREVADLSGRLSRLEAMVAMIPGAVLAAAPTTRSLQPALPPAPVGFSSLIVADFPALFADFRGNRFNLLWRGSRDGFEARDFHGRCDGHANTLTLIEDTEGNIFGGFTPVEWESRSNLKYKPDPSLKSFLFTLKNLHGFPARKFALKAENKDQAIGCYPALGPLFGGGGYSDIRVAPESDSDTHNFGRSYTNDTGLDGYTFFTGSAEFRMREIENFEMTN